MLVSLMLVSSVGHTDESPVHYATRGEVLYLTQCINCHRAKEHWKDQGVVNDRRSLQLEVRRWQDKLGLGWNDEDIGDVARFLNDTYYRFP